VAAVNVDGIVFDLYGTLLEVASVGRAAGQVTDDPAALVEVWRQKQLEYTWLRSLMGRHEDFWAVTADALDYALDRLGLAVDADQRSALLDAWLDVRPYPEVPAALAKLSDRKLGVLSNGSPDMLSAGLAAAGIGDALDAVISVEEAGVYKPHPSVYALAEKHFGVPTDRILFVSSNPWDAAGAKAFGLAVAWVNRSGATPERLGAPPDLVVSDLAELADTI
jgi:2-haloacid dehalogenase